MHFLVNHLFEIFVVQNWIGADVLQIGANVAYHILQCQIACRYILMQQQLF